MADPFDQHAYSLNPSQTRFFLEDALPAGRLGLNIKQVVCSTTEDIDLSRFREAWQTVANRHVALGVAFRRNERQEPYQRVWPPVVVPISFEKRPESEETEKQGFIQKLLKEDRRNLFDVAEAPLTRISVFQFADNSATWIWTFHQILMDGHSAVLVLEDVFACYEALGAGRAVVLPDRRPFADFIAWQQETSAAQENEDRTFWQRLVTNDEIDAVLSIKRGPSSSDFRQVASPLEIDEELKRGLRDFAAKSGFSLRTIIEGAWAVLLSRYYRTGSVTFGTIRFGRSGSVAGAENMIGVLSSFLPVHADFSTTPSIVELLGKIQEQQVAMRKHRWSSLDLIRGSVPAAAFKQLADTCVIFQRRQTDREMTDRFGRDGRRTFAIHEVSNIPLLLSVDEEPGLTVDLVYQASQFEDVEIAQLGRSLLVVLRQIYSEPNAPVAEIELLDAKSRIELIRSMTGPSLTVQPDRGLHQWFEDQVRRTPDRLAVIAECELTYEQLDRRATELARRLVQRGIGRDQLVAIFMPRSAAVLVAILAVLKSGAAYFPIDIGIPPARVRDLLEDGKVVAVLTDEKLLAARPESPIPWLVVSASEAEDKANAGTQLPPVVGSQLAYAISTSGTTGRPKLIGVEHAQASNLLAFATQVLLRPEDVRWVAFLDALSFDSSVSQIFVALSMGGTLVLIPDVADIGKSPYFDKFTCVQATPSLLAVILKSGGLAPSARLIGMGAEAIPTDLLEKIDQVSQIRKVVNYYGPTETTVYCTCSVVLNRDDPHHILDFRNRGRIIGRAIANTRVYVVDEHGHLAPPGAPGELYIAGAPVARGYLNPVGEAAANFGPDVLMPETGERLYRSGDLVCLRSDGQLEFHGRKDGQFKFNGVRIESAEIENALNDFPGVRQAVVDLATDAEGRKRVVAYLAADGARLSKSEVRRMLRLRLPDAMIPHFFFFLDDLPVTTNGKVDRRALARLRLDAQPAAESSAPLTAMEKRMTAVWEKNLSRSSIGPRHDYFEMGGDSLSAVNLVAAIEKQFGIKLKPAVLFDNANIAELCRAMENPADDSDSGPVFGFTLLQEAEDAAPLVILTGGSGTSFNHYKNFARKFAPLHPVFALQHPFALLQEKPSDPLEHVSGNIAGKIVEAVGDRPFVLFGHCVGAQLAWHVAAALRKREAPPFRMVLYAPMILDEDREPNGDVKKVAGRSRVGRLMDAYRPAWEQWRMDHGSAWWTNLTFARWMFTNFLVRRGWLSSRQEPFRFEKLSYLRLVVDTTPEVFPGDALIIHHHEEINPDFEPHWHSLCAGKLRFEYFPGSHRVWQTSILSILPLVHGELERVDAGELAAASGGACRRRSPAANP